MIIKIFLLICFLGGQPKMNSITNYFPLATSICIYQDGNKTEYKKDSTNYKLILNSLSSLSKDSYDMPAFGVSIDKETKKELNNGTWLELIFDKTHTFNEMPFETLLINVKEDYFGFNLIRKNNNEYSGRCFYLNTKISMKELFDLIKNRKN